MTKEEAKRVQELFEQVVNTNLPVRYGNEVRPAYLEKADDLHFYIRANTIIWEKEWDVMIGFSHISHCCIRYNCEGKEWELW